MRCEELMCKQWSVASKKVFGNQVKFYAMIAKQVCNMRNRSSWRWTCLAHRYLPDMITTSEFPNFVFVRGLRLSKAISGREPHVVNSCKLRSSLSLLGLLAHVVQLHTVYRRWSPCVDNNHPFPSCRACLFYLNVRGLLVAALHEQYALVAIHEPISVGSRGM